jgi:hypothetical protein
VRGHITHPLAMQVSISHQSKKLHQRRKAKENLIGTERCTRRLKLDQPP